MSTDQSYSGKESHATKSDLVGENATQTAKNEDTLIGGIVPASPTAEPHSENSTASAEQTEITLEGFPASDQVAPVSVSLPLFLSHYVSTPEKSALLRRAIRTVFVEFMFSDKSPKADQINEALAFTALEKSLDMLLVRATNQVAGPVPNAPIVVPGDLKENPYQSEAFPILMDNPANCTEVDALQKWIVALQDLNGMQNLLLTNFKKMTDNQEENVKLLAAMLTKEEAITIAQANSLNTQTRTIEELRKQIPGQTPDRASLTLNCEVNIGMTGRYGSGFNVLISALTEFRDSRSQLFREQLKRAEYEPAFNFLADSETAQEVLDDLHYKFADLARSNYHAAVYKDKSAQYREAIGCEPGFYKNCLNDFMNTYAPGVSIDETE